MGDVQKTKLAAIEAEWNKEPAPASFTLFGLPNQEDQTNHFEVRIPLRAGHYRHSFYRSPGHRHERFDDAA